MSKYIFSVNVFIDDEDMLEECLKSIYKNSFSAKGNVQVVVIDPICNKVTKNICDKNKNQYGDSFRYLKLKGQSISYCYNQARKYCDGEYINFIKSSSVFEKGCLSKVKKAFVKKQKPSVVCLNPVFFNLKGVKRNYLKFRDRNLLIDVEESIFKLNFCFNSYFFKADAIKDEMFDESILHESTKIFLVKTLDRVKQYYLLQENIYCNESLEIDYYNYAEQYYKTWYSDEITTVYLPMLDNSSTSRYVQSALLYMIQIKFACNMNDRHKSLLDEKELSVFLEKTGEVMAHIDDDIIAQYNIEEKRVLPRFMGINFLRLKYKTNEIETRALPDEETESYAVAYEDTLIENFDNIRLNIRAVNYDGKSLSIDGEVVNMYFADHEKIRVWATINDEPIEVEKTQIYALVKFFGITVKKGYMIKLTIPMEKLAEKSKIKFHLEYDNYEMIIPEAFVKPQSRLFLGHKATYWKFGSKILTYSVKNQCLKVIHSNPAKVFLKEIKYMAAAILYGKSLARSVKSVGLRIVYYVTKPFYKKKNIWITFDQLFKGGDNGEYFYRYVSELEDKNQTIYYVINKDAVEYPVLKAKYKTVLKFNSVRHKLLSLHARLVFTTRADAILYCGFWSATEKYFRGLLNAEILCLQHGLTIQRIAQYQNRLFDNIKLYFCVSKYEMENISHPVYGYDKSMLTLTGAPRYDGLISKPKRQIIITPTWRRNVTAGTNKKGSMHEYSVNFKHTEYFHVYNDLINDKKLIESAKRNNYKIIYLIHPILSPQIEDFQKNEFVSIVPGSEVNYEEILTQSSLMLTDHSGIQFDFAYMRKPLVYYHPDRLPPQYEEGGLKYETMGFGPVCKSHHHIVDELCNYMDRDCKLEDEYRNRIEDFFAFKDLDNCKRVHKEAVKFQDKLNRQKGN